MFKIPDSKSLHGPDIEKYSTNCSSKSTSQISDNQSRNNLKSQSNLSPQTAIALKILKRAFCTRETCSGIMKNSEIESITFSNDNNENSCRNKNSQTNNFKTFQKK